MKINFVLPGNEDVVAGGYKVIYQYANQLINRGNDVTISFLFSPRFGHSNWLRTLKFLGTSLGLVHKNKEQVTWYPLNPSIALEFNVVTSKQLKDADILVATSVETSYFVAKAGASKGRKCYFIQNYETWVAGEEYEDNSFRLGLYNIVIATWLQQLVMKKSGLKPPIVPNFLETDFFNPNTDFRDRGHTVALLNHAEPSKRTAFGLKVLSKLKKEVPDLEVNLFGVWDMPENLPKWIHTFENPRQLTLRDQIYGGSSVYLLPSLLEGWSLTGMEAMVSGAVVVASDIGGVRDYVINNETGLLIKPDDLEAFVSAIKRVFLDDALHERLVREGVKKILGLSIDRSTTKLYDIFKEVGN
ncbi:glycosyltransferase family 4 protein [Lacticaseibacillus paracasei]|uniref:glycosyltransferase family 4 protein n=1 Tax=Lacticaseibacillus paracasei TaxID=1597 RepID=UPI00237EA245|nr:glycosyltransferase family 4 protein [Lacticaseibacillus paracasei]MDE3288581.1 glycosyltransferase family 4 protein [Lacticaseibacillus paracasei]